MEIVNRNNITSFVTKDTAEIRELLAPANSSVERQSLAEATIHPGHTTQEHRHPKTEELYYILTGEGRIRIDGEERAVRPCDAIPILPGQRHKIWNTARTPLVFLCCCVPAYEHDDTVITEND